MSVHAAAPPHTPPSTSFRSASRLVAEREVLTMVRAKSFWVLFGLLVAGVFAASILPGLFGGGATSVATVGPEAERLATEAEFEAQPVADRQAAEEAVRAGDVRAAIVPDPDGAPPEGVRIIALSNEPTTIMLALSVPPPVDVLDPAEVSEPVQFLVAFAFALVFLVFAAGFGGGIAQSVVTEKQTRVVEILVATIPVRALLAGKIAGHSLLVFGQLGALALAAPLALRVGERGTLLAMVAPAIGWFVPFFLLGFVLLAAMWATAGALVSRMEDLGATSSVVTMLVMIPYFAVVFLRENDLVMTILSYVPFSAAVAMPLRLFTGDAEVWEPFLSMTLLAVALVVTVLVASRIYAGSLLQTSGRVTLGQAWRRAE